jgi:hypothetical protein
MLMRVSVEPTSVRDREEKIAAEQRLLAGLCQHSLDDDTLREVVARLTLHNFCLPDHEILFRALSPIVLAAPQQIKDAVKTRVTLFGFPDLDVEPFFVAVPPSDGEVRELLKQI